MIVHQSETKKGRSGCCRAPQVEVVAAVDDRPRPARPAPRRRRAAAAAPRPLGRATPRAAAAPARTPAARARPRPHPSRSAGRARSRRRRARRAQRRQPRRSASHAGSQRPVSRRALREMQAHVQELRGAIARMMQQSQWPGLAKLPAPLADLHQRLLDQEVEPALAQELVTTIDGELSLQAANDPATVRECLAKHLRRMLPTAGPLAPIARRADGRVPDRPDRGRQDDHDRQAGRDAEAAAQQGRAGHLRHLPRRRDPAAEDLRRHPAPAARGRLRPRGADRPRARPHGRRLRLRRHARAARSATPTSWPTCGASSSRSRPAAPS